MSGGGQIGRVRGVWVRQRLNDLSGLVMGQPRLELIGVTGSALPEMKALGWFTEVIQWKTRAFIPVGSTEVLAKVLVKYPVASSVAGRLS